MALDFSAASSWVVMDRLLAPRWRQVGPRAHTARVPPLFSHAIHSLVRASAGLSRSTRALLTSLALSGKPPRTPYPTLHPRAPSAERADDVAEGSSGVGSAAPWRPD